MKRQLVDYRVTTQDQCVEYFTLRNLDSMMVVNQNNSDTKSFILAPFNTSQRNNPEENTGKELLSYQNNLVAYAPCVIDAVRAYEKFNNGDKDSGNHVRSNLNDTFNLESSLYKEGNKPIILFNNQRIQQNELATGKNRFSSYKDITKGLNSYGVYNESIINQMMEIGYTKEFIIQSLRNNELNYCTATYFLLMKHVEKPENLCYN